MALHVWLAVPEPTSLNSTEHGATLPLDLLDEVGFAANPQVHAFDRGSILSTPNALATAVRDAVDIAAGRPLLVGPLTLAPIFNAVASVPTRSHELSADTRQHDALAADWALQAINAASVADAITIYETAGDWGVLNADGIPSPSYFALLEGASELRSLSQSKA